MSTPKNSNFHVQKQPIEVLFDAMFHGKWSFEDFSNQPVQENVAASSLTQAGKNRYLYMPNAKLKSFHDFIRLFLLDFIPFNEEVVFSYRKGMSAYDAVALHKASKSFFLCDIVDFFPSIKKERIKNTLLREDGLCPIQNLDIWIDRIVDLVSFNGALPMGFSTSPSLSNAVLTNFDNAFQKYCQDKGLLFTRYSDDIIVSSSDPFALSGIKENVEDILRETMQGEFSLHPNKSRFLHSGVKVKILGMVLLPNGRISVDARIKSEIEVLIHFYVKNREKFLKKVDGNVPRAEARLSGLMNYVNTIDQGYLDKLRKKFGVTIVDYFLHRSFHEL